MRMIGDDYFYLFIYMQQKPTKWLKSEEKISFLFYFAYQ